MSFNVNCITCQLVGKGPVTEKKSQQGQTYKYQQIELKVPRKNPKQEPGTGFDYCKMNAQTEAVECLTKIELFAWVNIDFVLRSFKTKDGKDYENRVAIFLTEAVVV